MNSLQSLKSEKKIREYFKNRIGGNSTKKFISNLSQIEFSNMEPNIRLECGYLGFYPKSRSEFPKISIDKNVKNEIVIHLINREEVSILVIHFICLINSKTSMNSKDNYIKFMSNASEENVEDFKIISNAYFKFRKEFP